MIDQPAPRLAVILIALATLALTTTGCGSSNASFVQHASSNDAGSHSDSNSDSNNGAHNGRDDAGTDTNGDGDDAAPTGYMTASWRLGNADDLALIADLDLVQQSQDTAVKGRYTMSDDRSGDIADRSIFDGQTLTLKWNPTDSPSELYTISAQKQDDGNFTGHLSAASDSQIDTDVVLTRYHYVADPDAGM